MKYYLYKKNNQGVKILESNKSWIELSKSGYSICGQLGSRTSAEVLVDSINKRNELNKKYNL